MYLCSGNAYKRFFIFFSGNVLKEICEPNGAIVEFDKFELGDSTLSLLEIWGAEYQESDAVLVHEKDVQLLKQIGDREKVPVCVVGNISGEKSKIEIFAKEK